MEIRQLLEIGNKKLTGVEFVDPIKESIFILSKVLDVDKSFVYINFDKWVNEKQTEKFLEIIDRRALGEPISYIFNTKEFMGIDFFVEKGVLIPRWETEILVEYIIDYIEKNFKDEDINLLDIGIGSGAISLSIAKNCKNVEVLGIDISNRAISVSNKNLDRLALDNVSFRKSNLFESIKSDERFSIIVSNPPYIKTEVIKDLQRDVKEFEPSLALDGGMDGLLFYRKISKDSKNYLLDKGMLIYEIGFDQGKSVKKIMSDEGFKDVKVIKDLQGLDRIVLGFKK
ncbi:peptide chain release factor N(5)-glutamine methyltransferase [Tissierella creatinophila]|uniref:Release factor glutamine methyltransferase n=1 Tax=Tissierella creatinophila DSM 6911 TaxID=1123403 RepID=A0A1U7M3B4_TISCR|nr:peptide chain release factor N(5)-glutamine methyltransferase [Tissierella creatinophila]OLS01813.1 release factor glutamine methyltransferase [Tissierella creatinophila DSM 6911]